MKEIWAVRDIEQDPIILIRTWQIIKVKHIDESITSHICGDEYWGGGRFSSTIQSFDGKVYTTQSGRRYVVQGGQSSYLSDNAKIVLRGWIHYNNVVQVCSECEMVLSGEHKMSCSKRHK